jgi:deoxyribodipyrimidine photolyase-related protein
MAEPRRLLVVLGDQLDANAPLLHNADPARDAIWMCECAFEADKVWSHKARITLFFAAMRHFAEALRARGWTVHYRHIGEHAHNRLGEALAEDLRALKPATVAMTEAGEWDVASEVAATVDAAGLSLETREDEHFLCSRASFADWLADRKQPRMEHFYRVMRRESGLLMEGLEPAGGRWNFDADNRASFGKDGPGALPQPVSFAPDTLTQQAIADVETHFGGHPGSLDNFDWPVTPDQAQAALADFITHRLPHFGDYQDAMWTGAPWLYHARIAAALNLKLLDPREACAAAESAWRDGHAPLNAVEGFVRQILGWREYVRGLYWARMPGYREANALEADAPLPAFYWSGDTGMNCLRETVGDTLENGYAHHIQRLMVTGLYALLLGVRPGAIHAWYLAIYVDAVEWVELPNVLGMSQWADGGVMASKPYVASGKYIQRMSNYCDGCRYRPDTATGPKACPFTTLYWDFLNRHENRFAGHPRLKMQINNLRRKGDEARTAIREAADAHRADPDAA